MRLDKFLKISRIIKRRTVANDACSAGRVCVNDKVAKASTEVVEGDILDVLMAGKHTRYRVLAVNEHATKESASQMVAVLDGAQSGHEA